MRISMTPNCMTQHPRHTCTVTPCFFAIPAAASRTFWNAGQLPMPLTQSFASAADVSSSSAIFGSAHACGSGRPRKDSSSSPCMHTPEPITWMPCRRHVATAARPSALESKPTGRCANAGVTPEATASSIALHTRIRFGEIVCQQSASEKGSIFPWPE